MLLTHHLGAQPPRNTFCDCDILLQFDKGSAVSNNTSNFQRGGTSVCRLGTRVSLGPVLLTATHFIHIRAFKSQQERWLRSLMHHSGFLADEMLVTDFT